MYRAILFDLDGTLTDSGEGIMKSVQYALEKIGRPEEDLSLLRCFVGPPLVEQFMAFAGIDRETAVRAVSYYRERYEPTGLYENEVYPGIRELLSELKNENYILAVASSKPEKFVRRVLNHFELDSFFDVIVGSELSGDRTSKKEVVDEVIRQLGMEDQKGELLLVGDRKYDVAGAREAGISCAGAAWGYGSVEELSLEHPAVILSEPAALLDFLRNQKGNGGKVSEESLVKRIFSYAYPVLIHFGISYGLSTAAFILSGGDESKIYSYTVFLTGVSGLLTAIPAFFFYRRDKERRVRNGVIPSENHGKLHIMEILLLMLFGCALCYYGNIVVNILQIYIHDNVYVDLFSEITRGKSYLELILWMGIVAPLVEEMIFRWLLYLRLRDRLSVWPSILISSLVFGIYHGNLSQAIYAFLLGAAFAYSIEATGSIWSSAILHMSANTFSLLVTLFTEELFRNGTEGMVLTFLAALLAILLFSFSYLRKRKSENCGRLI